MTIGGGLGFKGTLSSGCSRVSGYPSLNKNNQNFDAQGCHGPAPNRM